MGLRHIVAAAAVAFPGLAAADVDLKAWNACMPTKTPVKLSETNVFFDTPQSGGTGVFFVDKRANRQQPWKGGEVLKFTKWPEYGAAPARRILSAMQLPHDPLIGWTDKEPKIRAAADRLSAEAARQANGARIRFPYADPGRVDLLVSRLADHKGALLRTGLVEPAGHGETFGSMLAADSVRLTAAQKEDDLLLAVAALKRPANQQMLGALFIADLVLGNGDRMSKDVPGPNWNNIVIGRARKDGRPCLVAIDNDLVAPSKTQALFNAALAANPAGGRNVSANLAAGAFAEQMVFEYDDKTSGMPVHGPAVAFSALQQAPGRAVCAAAAAGARGVHDDQLLRLVADLQRLILMGVNALPNASWEDHPQRPNCAGFVRIGPQAAPRDEGIDWGEFESNFKRGVAYAIDYFVDTRKHSAKIRRAFDKDAPESVDRATWEGLEVRIDFLKHVRDPAHAAQTPQQIFAAMRQDAVGKNQRKYRATQRTFSTIALYDDWGVYVLN
jgi:hypothetical protein